MENNWNVPPVNGESSWEQLTQYSQYSVGLMVMCCLINHGSFSGPMVQNASVAEGRLSCHPTMAHLLLDSCIWRKIEEKRERQSRDVVQLVKFMHTSLV